MLRLLLSLVLSAQAAAACETALVLAIDVSNSIDSAEYRLQTEGMADALLDPAVQGALIDGQSRIAVLHWSGMGKQQLMLGWTPILTPKDAARTALNLREMERAFILSDTAPSEALTTALALVKDQTGCRRRVIDISGDGTPNAGEDVRPMRHAAARAGVTINAIAIESLGLAITNFYRQNVITADGFVITARGYREYPQAIRLKILREVSRVLG